MIRPDADDEETRAWGSGDATTKRIVLLIRVILKVPPVMGSNNSMAPADVRRLS